MGNRLRTARGSVIKTLGNLPPLLGLLLATVITCTACGESRPEYPQRHMPKELLSNDAELKAGHELFKNKCASCHGKPDEGRSDRAVFFQPPATDFTDAHFQTIDPAYLFWRIDLGKTIEPYRSQGSVMPAWGVHLSQKQIWQIVAYLQSRAH